MNMAAIASTALCRRLAERIRASGPISTGAYLAEALFDPREGFYATKDPIGAGEDFITAPEVSQMFGELICLWLAQCWHAMDEPAALHLAELGPGRGTMMKDILRTSHAVPNFTKALEVHLIEASPALINVQANTLADAPCPVHWKTALADLPAGPCLIIGNEFLDCLPVRQFIRHDQQWFERLVDVDADGTFQFVRSAVPANATELAMIPLGLNNADDGEIAEVRPAIALLMDELSQRFAHAPGIALFIDYGPAKSETGDTLQALVKHKKTDPLAAPGTADLTTRVDFEALAEAAKAAGLQVAGPVTQSEWLKHLGIEYRAADLVRKHPDQKPKLARQLHRLIDDEQMGALFKVIAITGAQMPSPEGFGS